MMTRKHALQLVLELASANSLSPRECDNDPDLVMEMQQQNEALMIVAEMVDEESPRG